jgi:AcrR family transcriptional regulator
MTSITFAFHGPEGAHRTWSAVENQLRTLSLPRAKANGGLDEVRGRRCANLYHGKLTMTQETRVRSRLPRAERERQILDTAHAMFAERGFGAVTMDDVAARVGVTKPLLYMYFGNKDRLYLACMERSGDALLAAVADAVGAAAGPADALREGVRAFFAFVDGDRDAWRVLFDETLPAGGAVALRVVEYRERLLRIVSQSRLALLPASRRARAATETEALSTALLGAAEALARWWLRTETMSSAAAADLLITTLEPGLNSLATRSQRDASTAPRR